MRLTRTIAPVVASLVLGGCIIGGDAAPPVTAVPTSAAACEAMRPAFPHPELDYDSEHDTAATVADVKASNKRTRSLNARFAATCP